MKVTIVFLSVLLSLNVLATRFGYHGSDASAGSSGYNGVDGKDAIIHTDGLFKEVILDGSNAGNGSQGGYGGHAYACNQPFDRGDVRGASGGDGGRGGNGGHGGDGGDVTIFYDHLSDLQNVYVSSRPGLGGAGAYGGRGGEACVCSRYRWSRKVCRTVDVCRTKRVCSETGQTRTDENGREAPVRICKNVKVCTPQQRCENRTYTCTNGSTGADGRSGSNGQNGKTGRMKLIKGLSEIPFERPSTSISMTQLEANDVVMSKNVWSGKSGAQSLLAAGSYISDAYTEFNYQAQKTFKMVWNTHKAIDSFDRTKLSLGYDARDISYKISSKDFFIVKEINDQSSKTLYINEAYKEAQVVDLTGMKVSGTGKKAKITIIDKSNMSLKAHSKVYLKLRVRRSLVGRKLLFEGLVPQRALDISEGQITIKLSELVGDMKFLKRKRKLTINLKVNRSLGTNSKDVYLSELKVKL